MYICSIVAVIDVKMLPIAPAELSTIYLHINNIVIMETTTDVTPQGRNVVAIIGFAFSLFAITFFWYPFVGFLHAIPGLILSAKGMKRPDKRFAKPGLIISIIALAVGLIWTIVFLVIVSAESHVHSYPSYGGW
jgi:hypothetical protein